MKIKCVTSQCRNDYSAIMVCEHCGHEQEDPYGYSDSIYQLHVIPKMRCDACNRDRVGNGENQ